MQVSSLEVKSLIEILMAMNSSDSDNDSSSIGGTIESETVALEMWDFDVVSFFLDLLIGAVIISSKTKIKL